MNVAGDSGILFFPVIGGETLLLRSIKRPTRKWKEKKQKCKSTFYCCEAFLQKRIHFVPCALSFIADEWEQGDFLGKRWKYHAIGEDVWRLPFSLSACVNVMCHDHEYRAVGLQKKKNMPGLMCARSANAQIYRALVSLHTPRRHSPIETSSATITTSVRRVRTTRFAMDNLFDESSFVRNWQEKIHICIQHYLHFTLERALVHAFHLIIIGHVYFIWNLLLVFRKEIDCAEPEKMRTGDDDEEEPHTHARAQMNEWATSWRANAKNPTTTGMK